ncbi:MAG TPA: pyridoxamine 5'-phosphate oxidase [Solirubrobacteraceae bacterium]|jgi:pyridoxamine 5'-phosphate oxidase|nr:pyridoxamine 5'-phosphate oxidase [Solirubrobacteraceae bacterium]
MPDYGQPLREQDVDADPLRQIASWSEQAREAGVREPEAAALATASADGAPSVRMLLVKHFDEHGFVFFTNYDSQKARELTANPHASLLFHWDALGRQARIVGPVERTSEQESAEYVRSRPYASQLSALASPQSHVLDSRATLEQRVAELEQEYDGQELPLPADWGGFRLRPVTIELWQQRHDRLHDRLRYRRSVEHEASWIVERLAP